MQWTGLNELREKFLNFFESKGHLRLPSYPLIPQGDKSLLLINSGMAPMKKFFTGEITPPRKRVTTCQKCIRTPDIERVGITARHGTYFEMLGNFSFGDYFKHEATAWAWEFFTEILEMPPELLYCSIYEEDDEAFEIWTKEIGVDPTHIVRLGKEDNFWEHGAGPCGPCSEIYFDRGEKYGCGSPTCGVGCECDRFVEVWNLVFTQFDSDGNNHYVPLEHPNIDTGMGLERLACVMQGVDNLFLVDTVQNIMKHISKIADVQYGEDDKTDVSLRVITDHIRSTTFMVGDGVMPSNEGRGYVLRRLLRRAARHGKLIGIDHPFLSQVAETVIRENENAYPELRDKAEMIKKLINYEEESFYRTIDQGLSLLNNFIDNANTNVFSGDDAFKLNDTYGFPLDLTKEILQERGMVVDEERFKALLLQQRDRARNARKNAEAEAWTGEGNVLENIAPTEFLGYDCMRTNSKILAIVKDGQRVNSADAGDEVIVVLDQTAFYAESGGQVGDQGILEGSGFTADVVSTTKNQHGQYLLKAIVEAGTFFEGDSVDALVNVIRRRAIMRNHTAAHLLQASLRKILGAHVEQAGQLVDENKVRFDFTHFSALTAVQLAAVESFVNSEIMKASTVECREMPIGEAKKLGAMALFGEKYGDRVRVVSVGEEFSKEFCGGTHVSNTAKLGLFKIVGEASAAAGIRRIEAVTGMGVMKLLNETTAILHDTASTLKVNNISELPGKAAHLNSEMREKEKALDGLNAKLAALSLKGLFTEAETVKGVKIISALISGADTNALRAMCDRVRDMAQENAVAAVFAGVVGEKAMLVAACSKSARELGLKAGNLVKAVAEVTGGNGGGKPDFAMAGAKDISKLDDALHAIPKIIEDQI